MPFYDHFHSGEVSDITPMGRATVDWRNRYFLRLIRQFSGKDPISLLEIGPGLGFFAEQCRQDKLDYTHNYPTCLLRLRGLFVDHDLEILHEDLLAIFVRGAWLTRFTAFLVRLFYGMGFFSLFFGRRAYKAKLSMLPECIIVGQLSSPSTSQAP